jgi:hypothetical protein
VGPGVYHPKDLHNVLIELTDEPLSQLLDAGVAVSR